MTCVITLNEPYVFLSCLSSLGSQEWLTVGNTPDVLDFAETTETVF